MSLCAPQSPFQRVCLPPTIPTGDPGFESTLQAESLSSSSYDKSCSSSSPGASSRGSSLSSDTAVKSESGWLLREGGGRLDWQLSVAENPGQLKLCKVWSFWIEQRKKEEIRKVFTCSYFGLILNMNSLWCRLWVQGFPECPFVFRFGQPKADLPFHRRHVNM